MFILPHIYICTTHTKTHKHTCHTLTKTHSHTHTHTYIHTHTPYIYTHTHKHTHSHIHIYIHNHPYPYIYTHVHICVHTHKNTPTYFHIPRRVWRFPIGTRHKRASPCGARISARVRVVRVAALQRASCRTCRSVHFLVAPIPWLSTAPVCPAHKHQYINDTTTSLKS